MQNLKSAEEDVNCPFCPVPPHQNSLWAPHLASGVYRCSHTFLFEEHQNSGVRTSKEKEEKRKSNQNHNNDRGVEKE